MSEVQKLERDLVKAVRQLRVADSLLFLNKVLAVSRGELDDPETQSLIARQRNETPAFVIHIIVKYLMQHGRMNTPVALDAPNFPNVLHCAFQLAIADPLSDSSDSSVHGYLVRMMSQQMGRQIIAQSYGLAIGLFQDLDTVAGPKPIDLRREVEDAIKMPVELFMRIGQAAHAATCAKHGSVHLRGTLNLDWLSKAAIDIPDIPWVEKWPDFVRVTSFDQQRFNAEAQQSDVDHDYAYGLSPLRRHPLIQVAPDRFIAVDPLLVVERTSWGVFYDIFEKYQKDDDLSAFTEPFGYAFERFVDNLLQSALAADSIWRETDSPAANRIKDSKGRVHQIGDLAYRSKSNPVLIEVTSARPTREYCALARKDDLQRAATRIAKEVLQTFDHIRSIQNNAWSDEGLVPGQWVGLVVTFGRFETINGPFFRKLINEQLGADASKPYLVLSLVELDYVVKLVEGGRDFGALIAEFAADPSFDPVGGRYAEELRHDAVSSFAKARTARMYNFLPPSPR
jgi:hypothetical protein